MKYLGTMSVTFFLTFFCVVATMASSLPTVIAQVGNVPITRFELAREIQRIIPLNMSVHGGISPEKKEIIRDDALDTLITQAFKVQFATANQLEVSSDEVEGKIERVWKEYKTIEGIREALGEESLDDLRGSVRRVLLGRSAEKAAVDNRINISDAQVKRYYEENRANYVRPRSYRASHILIKVDPSADEKTRLKKKKKAEELAAKGKSGEDFYNLAYYNSDHATKFTGGDMGFFHEGSVIPAFSKALNQLEEGDVSDVIESLEGYHVLKLVEKHEVVEMTFKEARPLIQKSLKKQLRDRLYSEWMDSLKKTYPVLVYLKKD